MGERDRRRGWRSNAQTNARADTQNASLADLRAAENARRIDLFKSRQEVRDLKGGPTMWQLNQGRCPGVLQYHVSSSAWAHASKCV
jgi:hypothetical protein